MKKLVTTAALAAALLVPVASAQAEESGRVGVKKCPGGVIVYYYDLNNQYQELFATCIYP